MLNKHGLFIWAGHTCTHEWPYSCQQALRDNNSKSSFFLSVRPSLLSIKAVHMV